MRSIEQTRGTLLEWLDSSNAQAAQQAIVCTGTTPAAVRQWLTDVTEEPDSASRIVGVVEDARRRGLITDDDVGIERWLLVRQGLDLLTSPAMARLGDSAHRLTCHEIATFARESDELATLLPANGIRFREFAKVVTGRRFCGGVFHWEECGIRRSWLLRVPPCDWIGFGRTLLEMRGITPMMFPHLNPRRQSPRLDADGIRKSMAVFAESIERRPDLKGLAAASWLRSPDTHHVSPRLAVVNATILEHGGFVTTVGRAEEECGVFEHSSTRRRLYAEGKFAPTIGLVLWPRADMLRWLSSNRSLVETIAA